MVYYLRQEWIKKTPAGLVTPYIDVKLGQNGFNIGSSNVLVLSRNKSLSEPMLRAQATILYNELQNCTLRITDTSLRAQWVKLHITVIRNETAILGRPMVLIHALVYGVVINVR